MAWISAWFSTRRARLALPGGDRIGARAIDLHLRGLEALGADITLDAGDIIARIPRAHGKAGRLRGARRSGR